MAWSYDPSALDISTAAGRLNVVRFLVGDTDTSDQQVDNDEITFALSENGDDVYSAGAYIAKNIAAKYARQVDLELDGQLSASYGDLAKQYKTLSSELASEASVKRGKLGFAAGGLTKTDIDSARNNDERVKPTFRRDQFWNPPNYDGLTGYEDS